MQDQLEIHRPEYMFAKLELSWVSKSTVYDSEGMDLILTHRIMLCIIYSLLRIFLYYTA